MARIGISMSINVTTLDKSRFVTGEKGTYLDLTAFLNLDEKDQYGNAGFITQTLTKEERETKDRQVILGNSKIFFDDRENNSYAPTAPTAPSQAGEMADYIDDDIPF